MSLDSTAALDVFFSYSHRDEELRDALETHLALLKRQGLIRAWHDRRIAAGREWEGEIDEHLEAADLILLLISPDFLASDYCYDRETGRALERHERGEARVIPIVLRPCDWHGAPFGKLQGLPRDARPVTSWNDRDEAFLDVARALRKVIEGWAPASTRASPPDDSDPALRGWAAALEKAYEERAELEADGRGTKAIDESIAGLKRRMRQDCSLEPVEAGRPAPVAMPYAAPTAPEQIRERVQERDGSVLVYVPGGEYVLGADDINEDSRPVHKVELSPYWIGKHPVTNEQYGRFLKATDHREPAYWNAERLSGPRQPAVGVTWHDAQAYCEWAGLALPTEAQWEAAARGPDQRKYPWGSDEPGPSLADFGKNFFSEKPDPVGSHPLGAGPFGTFDQAGNVWEWCQDLWNPNANARRDGGLNPVESGREDDELAFRVVRGGSWWLPSRFLRAAFRGRDRARDRDDHLGFRVCCSVPEHGA